MFCNTFQLNILCDIIRDAMDLIERAIKQFWKRLVSVIAAKDGYIEHTS